MHVELKRVPETEMGATNARNTRNGQNEPPMHCLTGAAAANTDSRADVSEGTICVHQCPSVVSWSRRPASLRGSLPQGPGFATELDNAAGLCQNAAGIRTAPRPALDSAPSNSRPLREKRAEAQRGVKTASRTFVRGIPLRAPSAVPQACRAVIPSRPPSGCNHSTTNRTTHGRFT
jgi:hypothetical protein